MLIRYQPSPSDCAKPVAPVPVTVSVGTPPDHAMTALAELALPPLNAMSIAVVGAVPAFRSAQWQYTCDPKSTPLTMPPVIGATFAPDFASDATPAPFAVNLPAV